MSLEVGVHHTPQEVREIVAWQRYQTEQRSRSASFKSNFSSKSAAIESRSSLRQQNSALGKGRVDEEALYSNSDFHNAPEVAPKRPPKSEAPPSPPVVTVPPIPQRKPTVKRPPISPTPPPIPDKISPPPRSQPISPQPTSTKVQEATDSTHSNPKSNKIAPLSTPSLAVPSPKTFTIPSPQSHTIPSPSPSPKSYTNPSRMSHAVPCPSPKFNASPGTQNSPLRLAPNRPRITERIRPPPRSPGTPQPVFWNNGAESAELQLRDEPPQPTRPQVLDQQSPSRPPRTDASPAAAPQHPDKLGGLPQVTRSPWTEATPSMTSPRRVTSPPPLYPPPSPPPPPPPLQTAMTSTNTTPTPSLPPPAPTPPLSKSPLVSSSSEAQQHSEWDPPPPTVPLPEWLQFHSLSRKREKGQKNSSRVSSPKEEEPTKQSEGRADLIDLAVALTSRRRSLKELLRKKSWRKNGEDSDDDSSVHSLKRAETFTGLDRAALSSSGGGRGDSREDEEDDTEDDAEPMVIPMKTTAIQREPTYANAVVQRQMRRDEESHYANTDIKNTSPWIGGSRRITSNNVTNKSSDSIRDGGSSSKDSAMAKSLKRQQKSKARIDGPLCCTH